MIRFAIALAFALLPALARADVQIQTITSPGGIDAWLVEEHSLPFVAIELRFRGGTSLDAPGKRGAVNLMSGLLEEGSGDMDATAFQIAREALAASYQFRSYDDVIAISARMLSDNREAAVDLLHQALVEPRFDDVAIERVRGQVLAGLESKARRPGSIASQAFYASAFPGHPYGSDSDGTPESVAALTRDDIIAAHDAALARGRVYVSAVGDITAPELEALIDRLLDGLPQEGPPLPGRAEFAAPGGIEVIDFATPQSVAIFGQPGIRWEDPDYFAAYVLNYILGGSGFESRLMQEVREKRGLTYGIGTSLATYDHGEMIVGSFSSGNDSMAQAVQLVRSEWARLASGGVTEDELDAAKTYLTGEYPLRFDGNEEIARIMVGMQMIDLPPEYVTQRNSYIEAVTVDEVNRVAAEMLQPDALHFTVVGQPEGLE